MGGSHRMPAKWNYKLQQQAAAIQARWNKINGTNKAAVIIIILLYEHTVKRESLSGESSVN